jgi:hypothetical protein
MAAGAQQVAESTLTPWETLNARLEGPEGLATTVFGPPADQSG